MNYQKAIQVMDINSYIDRVEKGILKAENQKAGRKRYNGLYYTATDIDWNTKTVKANLVWNNAGGGSMCSYHSILIDISKII